MGLEDYVILGDSYRDSISGPLQSWGKFSRYLQLGIPGIYQCTKYVYYCYLFSIQYPGVSRSS